MYPLPDRSAEVLASAVDLLLQPWTTSPDPQMTVEVSPDGTVRVSGEIDSDTAPHLHRTLMAALCAHPEGVTLDLSAVTFCDCAGLRAFLAARLAHLDGGRCPLALGPVSPRMARLLRLTGTEGLFRPPR
ncbi:STAS domain-containing protein [Streptomyces sp. NPDC058326]|uniref:STAS domain-containing protein n=1 Tax=Streptomyces sp. NPDC058326 TaxID=3346447 RepID=UPI0036E15A77